MTRKLSAILTFFALGCAGAPNAGGALANDATAVQLPAAVAADEGPSVTIYSSADPASFDPQRFIAQQRNGYDNNWVWNVPGFGVVKDIRHLSLDAGRNELRFTDVAEYIDPTTVSFTDLTDPEGTMVLEQNFQFDLVSPSKLLEKYVDREITADVVMGDETERVRGTLLSASQGQLVVQTSNGLRLLNAGAQVRLGELPGGLITRPTLVWKLDAEQGGEHEVRTTYQTGGLTWRSDYNLVLNADDTRADLGAWVTLMNVSGAAYENARLKLIAGDVQRVTSQPEVYRMGMARSAMKSDSGFEEKTFFEYHLYTLPRRTDVLANTTQQITLFPTAQGAEVEKVMVYYGLPDAAYWGFFPSPRTDRNFGAQSNPKVDVYIRFENEEQNKLGMPLPAGKVRVYKMDDADGTLEFIGEDLIGHTPRDETVLVKVGQAFDVIGERVQTDFSIDNSRDEMFETIRVELRNHKDSAERVIVKENLYRWTNWEIVESNVEHEKIDSRTMHFDVDVPARGERTITYKVRYWW
jgi:hypothetical protein